MKNKTARRILFVLTILLSLFLCICLLACETKKDDGEKKGITVVEDNTPSDSTVTFTVSFNANGGSAVSSVTAKVNSKISRPFDPTRAGYSFEGWYTSPEYFIEWDFGEDIVTSNITLYARWELVNDILIDSTSFSVSGGQYFYSVNATTETLSLTGKITLKNADYKYTFYSDKECKNPVDSVNKADLSLEYGDNIYYVRITDSALIEMAVVKFTVKRNGIFKVAYYGVNGELLNMLETEENSVLAEPYDYYILGHDTEWKTADGKKWVFGSNGTKITGDVDLYANATIKTYSVELDVNGGNENYTVAKVTYGSYFSLPVPTKAGAGFSGWYTSDGVQITGSNGSSLTVWDIQSDVTLSAKWMENSVETTHFVMLNDDYVTREVSGQQTEVVITNTVFYGKPYTFENYSEFGRVNRDGYSYTLYVFGGWYDERNGLLSMERSYSVSSVEEDTVVTEKWYSVTVSALGGVDQVITFASESFDRYGNITRGERVTITADCSCEEHTFVRWSTGETQAEINLYTSEEGLNTADGSVDFTTEGYVLTTEWSALQVSFAVYVDGIEVSSDGEYAFLFDALSGDGNVRKGRENTVYATSQSEYTFMGWFEGEERKSDELQFDYSFVMIDSLVLSAKWYKTTKLFDIVSDNEGIGRVIPVPNPANNIVGGKVTLSISGSKGYVLDALYEKKEESGSVTYGKRDVIYNGEYERTLPDAPVSYEARFVENKISVLSNTYNAGKISYSINGGRSKTGTNYGGTFRFDEMLSSEYVTLTTETYNGYAWLGWYSGDDLLTSDHSYRVENVITEREITACWKPISYDVNVTAGVYSSVTVAYINKTNLYYTYDASLALFVPVTTVGAAQSGVRYYTFSNNTYTGGEQKATAIRSEKNTGEDVVLTATINPGYRFEGWFDENNERITVEKTYVFNIKDLGMNYKAVYMRLPSDYDIQVGVFEGTETEPAPTGAGTVEIYAYYVARNGGGYSEICVVDVKTTKNEISVVSDSLGAYTYTYRGYNYLGMYSVSTAVQPTWISFQNNYETPDNNFFNNDVFGYRYTYNVTERRENGQKDNFMVAWRRGNVNNPYYSGINVYTENINAGELYYLIYNTNSLILVAEPHEGYLFAGWYTRQTDGTADVLMESDFVYAPGADYPAHIYVAKWTEINSSTNAKTINVHSATTRDEGGFSVFAAHPDARGNDLVTFNAFSNDGYMFLGWYLDDTLLTTKEKINILRKYTKENNVTTETMYLANDDGSPYGILEDADSLEPRWRKTDAKVIVESVGDVTIVGFNDNNGDPWYRLTTSSTLDFEDEGNAWYKGYYFLGWYDENNELLCREYDYYVKAGYLKTYYKAVWTDVNVSVSINGTDEEVKPYFEDTGGTATYGFSIRSDGRMFISFYAFPENGYTFMGWVLEGKSEADSYALTYNIPLGNVADVRPETLHVSYSYKVSFQGISVDMIPSAKLAVVNEVLTEPIIIGYRNSMGDVLYRLTARDLDGYIFEGWQRSGENTPYTTTRTIEFEDGSVTEPPVAIYRELTDYYPAFGVNTPKAFASDVHYYGYYENGERVVEIKANTPEGYLMRITDNTAERNVVGTAFEAVLDEESGEYVPLRKDDVFSIKLKDGPAANAQYNMEFVLISGKDMNDGYVQTQQQVKNVIVSYTGNYTVEKETERDKTLAYVAEKLDGNASLYVNGKSFSIGASFTENGATELLLSFTFIGNTAETDKVIFADTLTDLSTGWKSLLTAFIWEAIDAGKGVSQIASNEDWELLYRENSDYQSERWTLATTFDDMNGNEYTFIGWYDEYGQLLSTKENYEIAAQTGDIELATKFGIYRVVLENTNKNAGIVSVVGYDVTVSFDLNLHDDPVLKNALGGITIPTQTINLGESVYYPTQPVDKISEKYMFGGWFETKNGEGEPFDFKKSIKSSITLYAKWISATEEDGTIGEVALSDGTPKTLSTSEKERKFYFTALSDSAYKLSMKNSYSSQTTYITVYGSTVETEQRGILTGEIVSRFEVSDNVEVVKYFTVEMGKTYVIGVTAKAGTTLNTFTFKLSGSVPTGMTGRDNTVPFAGSFSVVATPIEYNSENYVAYKFAGWYVNDVLVSDVDETTTVSGKNYTGYSGELTITQDEYARYADESGLITMVAKWIVYEVEIIVSDSRGGRYSVELLKQTPSDAILENEGDERPAYTWEMIASPFAGYEFGGWYKYDTERNRFSDAPIAPYEPEGDNYKLILEDTDTDLIVKCQWVYINASNRRSITYTMNMEDAVNSMYNPSEFVPDVNNHNPIVLYDAYKYYYEDGVLSGYYVFEGWYTDSSYNNRVTEIDPSTTTTDVRLYAKWGKAIKKVTINRDEDGIPYFYLGECPQTLYTDVPDAAYESGTNLYYSRVTGLHYVGVDNSSSEREYYAIEPIRWDIIGSSNGLYVVSHDVLYVTKYNIDTNKRDGFSSNNWENSGLRRWLNDTGKNGFVQYFASIELNLINASIVGEGTTDNSAGQGNPAYSEKTWSVQNNTEDTVFALSYRELTSDKNGYLSSAGSPDNNRKANYSDYAKYLSALNDNDDFGYWTRSVGNSDSTVYYVTESGMLAIKKVNEFCGVRAALRLAETYITEE